MATRIIAVLVALSLAVLLAATGNADTSWSGAGTAGAGNALRVAVSDLQAAANRSVGAPTATQTGAAGAQGDAGACYDHPSVPEPATISLMAFGIGGLAAAIRRRRKA